MITREVLSPRRGTLVWRLYAVGALQLVILAATVFWVGYLLRPLPPPGPGPLGGPPGAPWDPALPPPPPEGFPPRPGGLPLAPLVTFLASGLVIVGAGSLVIARSLVGPLSVVVRAARALGSGDLSARTRLTDGGEIGEVGRAFDDMAGRLERLIAAEREMLANVSHELRTPLARIRVALDLASEAQTGGDRAGAAEILEDLSELEALIDDIFTASRLQARLGPGGSFPLRRELVEPLVLCDRAAERFRARHPDRPLDLRVDDELPRVEVDPTLLRRALDNLLENAHRYSPDPASSIELRATARQGGVTLSVVDHGAGIAPEDLPHVFTPFFRAERSRSRAAGGVGLGLTLTRRIVEAHGGRIDVASAPGAGTTVRVELDAGAQPVEA